VPRRKIKAKRQVEWLSILDENAELDKDVEPDIDKDRLAEMHRAMLRARRFDERLLQLQREGRIGTFAPVKGQEAAQVGAVASLRPDDWMVPAFRETAAMLWRGIPMEEILLYNAGFNEGGAVADDQYTLPIAIPVATQIPHAVGLAYAMKLRGEDRIAMTFFGDGATSEGDFHEALNFAGVYRTPTVLVCQNNGWAISTPRSRQTRSETLAEKALAYDVPAMQVDGNDLLAVHAAAAEAVERARGGDGPTMIECLTYRMSVHTTADDPSKYRSDEEVEAWARRDPIERLQRYLMRRKLLNKKKIESLEHEISEEIKKAWEKVQERIDDAGGSLQVMFDYHYAVMPGGLRAQREALSGGMDAKD
jgi:pyruvate dehydrogenase E1 component alpha subunit